MSKSIKYIWASLALLIIAMGANMVFAAGDGAPWAYKGHEGPANWGSLSNAYATCKTGIEQSPIDIRTGGMAHKALPPVTVGFNESGLDMVNNGHTIQANYETGSGIEIDGVAYNLLQYHFHSPSEHTINGKHAPMEMHLVHMNGQKQLAVIGVMIQSGSRSAFLSSTTLICFDFTGFPSSGAQ